MMNINEGDGIRSRVVGAGVNAESGRGLAFAATDPLSEVVYSSHKGLSLKFASSRTAHNKPFLLWNVDKAWGTSPDDDMFVDKPAHSHDRESIGKMAYQEDLNLQLGQHTADLQAQKVADAGALNNETKSRICLYKEKGKEKALSDESDRSCNNAAGLGIKRQGYVEDVMHETKRIKNQIPLFCGSTPIPRPDNPFMSWISNMMRGFSDSNTQDSPSFPLPLASSIDVNAQILHQSFIDAQDSASLDMGFQTMVQSLSCKDMNILNTGGEKENDAIEESIQLMVDDKKRLDDLCLSKQIIVCDDQARDGVIIPAESFPEQMNYAAEKPGKRNCSGSCKEIIQETIGCSTSSPKLNLDSGMNVVFPTDEKNLESIDDSQVNHKCSTNTEVSVDLKLTNKVCPIQKFGSSEALAPVFATRLGAPLGNEYRKSRLYDIVPAQNTLALSEIFQAIQNLRLSRADILRWMNSDVSLSHLNGFFLRLRLRKMEQGLKGTSYYVACISAGEGREVSGCTSNKSIMVDVGGIKSCITSQYVSNHDFLQDEIKDWWCRAVDRGCKVPSLDELNSKFIKRTSLGF